MTLRFSPTRGAGTIALASYIRGPGASELVLAGFALLNTEDQTITGGANVTSKSLTAGDITVDCGARALQYITNDGAFEITAPTTDGSCMLLITNGASAGAVTFTGFTMGALNVGDALTTTDTNKFTVSIWRIHSVSGYRIAAHQ